MKIIKKFKNNELLTFTNNNYSNLIKIYIDDNYGKDNIEKGYKINLIDSNKGSYKGSFMNNYICKKFKSNQKLNLTNIETNKILNYCKYFLLSENEYINLNLYNKYKYFWFLRSSYYYFTHSFLIVGTDGTVDYYAYTYKSGGFIPFFMKKIKERKDKK